VFIVTLLLIGDIRVSLWVFASVALILVDIVGSMHFWGLTIEMVTSIDIILAVGLAVDYSAHVGHMYVALSGSRAGEFFRRKC
jgi:multidrug efflux pump subunit AcrB